MTDTARPRWLRQAVSAAAGIGVLAAMAAAQVAVAPAASALDVDGYPRSTTPLNHDADKTRTVSCGGSARPIGVGGRVMNGNNNTVTGSEVFITELEPVGIGSNVTTVRATASESVGGHDNQWKLRVRTICATDLAGYEVVSSSVTSTGSSRSATAVCPGNTSALSGGAGTSGVASGNDVLIKSIWPSGGQVTVTADYHGPSGGDSWTLTAYAFCAAEPNLTIRSSGPQGGETDRVKDREVDCPSGTQVYGMGFQIIDMSAPSDWVHLSRFIMNESGVQVSANMIPAGDNLSWGLQARAICGP